MPVMVRIEYAPQHRGREITEYLRRIVTEAEGDQVCVFGQVEVKSKHSIVVRRRPVLSTNSCSAETAIIKL